MFAGKLWLGSGALKWRESGRSEFECTCWIAGLCLSGAFRKTLWIISQSSLIQEEENWELSHLILVITAKKGYSRHMYPMSEPEVIRSGKPSAVESQSHLPNTAYDRWILYYCAASGVCFLCSGLWDSSCPDIATD